MNKNNALLIRRQIDKKLIKVVEIKEILKQPKDGWLRIVREALGMSASQLARRLGISPPAITKVEKNEALGGVSINTMKKFAEQLECEFVYYLVPKEGSLAKTVEKKVFQYALKLSDQVSHTMALEDQGISEEEKNQQILDACQELLSSHSHKIWD